MPRSLLAVLIALLPLACGDGAPAGPVQLKLGHVGAPGSLFAVSSEEFARRVNERLGDRVSVTVFGSSQLGGDELLLQKLKLGTVDLALPSSILSSYLPEFGLFEMPYLVRDREHMTRIEEEVVWPDLVPLARRQGYEILAVWENGFRHVTNNVRPVSGPADLAGIKLRTPRGVWRVRMFQALGANPTPMPLSEVFVALQTGVMDGQENPFAQIWASRFQEVQEYLSLTGHVYTPAYLTAGTVHWERLHEDLRGEIEEIARDLREFVHATAAEMDRDLLERIREAGVEVNETDREAFVEASQAIYQEFAAEVPDGARLVERARSLAGTDATSPGDSGSTGDPGS